MMKAFVITAAYETDREQHVKLLQSQLPAVQLVEAVYPSRQKVPFLNRLIQASKQRTGVALNAGEIGVLLSNRKIWREIVRTAANDTEPFLILESDSRINNLSLLLQEGYGWGSAYDLFFFGCWTGHIKLTRSSKKKIVGAYSIGEPYIKTVCGAYGYSLNRKAARYLLQRTGAIAYPVDEFKKYMEKDALKMGGVVPELVSALKTTSTIGHPEWHPLREKAWMLLLDIRNTIISFFK